MAYARIKTEHGGAKNGGGAWMTRTEAKENAKRQRRQTDKQTAGDALLDDWGDLGQFSAHASRGVLRHMTEEEAAAGFSWGGVQPEQGTRRGRGLGLRLSVSHWEGSTSNS